MILLIIISVIYIAVICIDKKVEQKLERMNKNIHIIKTDKPSRLFYDISKDKLVLASTAKVSKWFENKNIHITSDEDIKSENWYLTSDSKILKCRKVLMGLIYAEEDYGRNPNGCQKIILTTDPDLIADGVQAIDDEFLEWFIKNPSCEKIEVMNVPDFIYETEHSCYKIIIPSEEPKQETLEEAAEKLFPIFNRSTPFGSKYPWTPHKEREAFKRGAKWQQERCYSEGDLREAYFSAIKSTGEGWNGEYAEGNNPNIEEKFTERFEEWFEQFKKK